MKKIEVCIYGAGRHGKVLMDIIESIPYMNITHFIDDTKCKNMKKYCGYDVKDPDSLNVNQKNENIAFAISNNVARSRLFDDMKMKGFECPDIIHPSAIISKYSKLGGGVQALYGSIINIDTRIGCDTIVHSKAIVDHDCKISSHVSIWPGAVLTGGVQVGKFSYIGSNAVVIPDVKIGANSIVGAGSVVIEDVPNDPTDEESRGPS